MNWEANKEREKERKVCPKICTARKLHIKSHILVAIHSAIFELRWIKILKLLRVCKKNLNESEDMPPEGEYCIRKNCQVPEFPAEMDESTAQGDKLFFSNERNLKGVTGLHRVLSYLRWHDGVINFRDSRTFVPRGRHRFYYDSYDLTSLRLSISGYSIFKRYFYLHACLAFPSHHFS